MIRSLTMKGRNKNAKNGGGGLGFNKIGLSSGISGQCVCVKCGYLSTKNRGIPCMQEKCPECGAVLLREGGYHHRKAKTKN